MKKQCSVCREKLVKSKYGSNVATKDGLHHVCKDCRKEHEARIRQEKKAGTYTSLCRKPRLTDEEREERKEKAKEYQREYRRKNQEELRRKKREYERSAYGICPHQK